MPSSSLVSIAPGRIVIGHPDTSVSDVLTVGGTAASIEA